MQFVRDAWPIVVIVATITGAAWTAAWNVRDFLTTQTTAIETRLSAQIAASEARLTVQLTESEARLAAQIAENQSEIAELRQYLVDHLGNHANSR